MADRETVRRVLIGTCLQDYHIEWGDDEEWKSRADSAPREVEDALLSLAKYWKYARNTAVSPWISMTVAGSYASGVLEAQNIQRSAVQISEELWDNLLGESELNFFLVGSQTLAYSGFYFAYESFLTECCNIRDANIDANELFGFARIKQAIQSCFNSRIEQEVWSDQKIEIARRARNSLAHNGGRPDDRLAELAPDLMVDGYVCIHPAHVSNLFQTLKQRLDLILRNW